MKFLFDENLSPLLIRSLSDLYPSSQHIESAGLRGRTDFDIWALAKRNELTIVSKDHDFRDLSFLHGPPPRVIWLCVGNAGTAMIEQLLRNEVARIKRFCEQSDDGLLELFL